jgi:hypothetical protein
MVKTTIASGNILSFQGDALICFCDSDLTYKKNNPILQAFERNTKSNTSYREVVNQSYSQNKEHEDSLIKELSAIGYCEIGNAVITQGLGLRVKSLIFVPYINHNDSQDTFSYVLFHKALRAAFTLATVYKVKTLAIPTLKKKILKREFIDRLFSGIFEMKTHKGLTEEETLNITIAIAKEFDSHTLQEVIIYR